MVVLHMLKKLIEAESSIYVNHVIKALSWHTSQHVFCNEYQTN